MEWAQFEQVLGGSSVLIHFDQTLYCLSHDKSWCIFMRLKAKLLDTFPHIAKCVNSYCLYLQTKTYHRQNFRYNVFEEEKRGGMGGGECKSDVLKMFLETKQNMKRSLTSALESASQAKADMARAALLCTLVLLKNNVLNVRNINIIILYNNSE